MKKNKENQQIKEGALNEEELNNVSGGSGCNDRVNKIEQFDTPQDVVYIYHVGQEVQVYNSDMHTTTFTGTIIGYEYKYHKNGRYYYDYYAIKKKDSEEIYHRARDYIQKP